MTRLVSIATLLAVCLVGVPQRTLAHRHPGPPQETPPNILLLLADDIGVQELASYGTGQDLPVTPCLDALAAGGLRFTDAWASPVCTPSRANLLTGRFGFRTGFGTGMPQGGNVPLSLEELLIPEVLDLAGSGYTHAAIGKWHLAPELAQSYDHPNQQGFGHYAGILGNPIPGTYRDWQRIENGVVTDSTTFLPQDQVDSALGWIEDQDGPWFCYLSFTSAHDPYPRPPDGTYTEDLTGLDPTVDLRAHYKATIENLDYEIARLLDELGPALDDTLVVFAADNGTPVDVTPPPFDPAHAKGSVYEGGVRVPLIVSGAGLARPGETEDALVHLVDLFATVLEVAGVDARAIVPSEVVLDSISFAELITQPEDGLPRVKRIGVFAEMFQPNRPTDRLDFAWRTVRSRRYKLVRLDGLDELYDLSLDPLETADLLLGPLTTQQGFEYLRLSAMLQGLLGSE